jgi:head-tail adaptor
MNPGLLNREVEVQTQATTTDAAGQPLNFWTTLYRCFASIDIQGGALLYVPTEFMENVLYRITVRYDPSFTILPNMRVLWNDRWKNICHVFVVKAIWNDKSDYRQVTFLAHEIDGDA